MRTVLVRYIFPAIMAVLLVAALGYTIRAWRQASAFSEAAPTQEGTEPMQMTTAKTVFDSPLAGRWYEKDRDKLATEIDGYIEKADTPALENVCALIAPHAGYRYSGQVAAYGLKAVKGKTYSRVIVMGPSHQVPMEDIASVPKVAAYRTPLGEVALDTDFIESLKKHSQFRCVSGTDELEHSVQIQLPLLQRALGEFKLVPIVVGHVDEDTGKTMARILGSLIDSKTLVIASSDFTHFGPNYGYQPFRDDVQNNLKKLDMGAYDLIEKRDLRGFYDYIDKTGATICGQCPIGILLAMLPSDAQPHMVRYDTSGNLTGDTTNSVSYFSIAFTGQWKKGEPVKPSASEGATLTDEDKTQLLALARATLESYVKNRRKPSSPEEFGIQITPGMSQIMGAFVTLTENGELRGCIGEINPRRPLYKAVMDHAINAGANDRRFMPVSAQELPLLHYEITAWPDDPKPVASYKDIVLGKHGIVLEKEGYKALFLPQVAPEQGWDIEQTLTHLAMKAGLPADGWKQGAKFSVFEGIIFEEGEH